MMEKKAYKLVNVSSVLILIYLLASILVGLAGCSPAKIRAKAMDEYKASANFPRDCADSFPVIHDTTFMEGKTDTLIDFRYYDNGIEVVKFDTVTDTQIIEITRTIRKTDTIRITKIDSARTEAVRRQAKAEVKTLSDKLFKTDKALEKQTSKLNKRTKERNWGWGLFGAMMAFSFRHQILQLLSGGIGKFGGLLLGLFRRNKK